MPSYICQRCGIDFTEPIRTGPKPKYCMDCKSVIVLEHRKEQKRRYYAKSVGKTVDQLRAVRPRATEKGEAPPPKPSRRFRWMGKSSVCLNPSCPFKNGNRPCLFYFEYADGSFTCANMRKRVKRKEEE